MKKLFKASNITIAAAWFFLGNFLESMNIDKWISLGAIAFFSILALIFYRLENRSDESKKLDSYDVFDFFYTWYGAFILLFLIYPIAIISLIVSFSFFLWCLSLLIDPNAVSFSEFLLK